MVESVTILQLVSLSILGKLMVGILLPDNYCVWYFLDLRQMALVMDELSYEIEFNLLCRGRLLTKRYFCLTTMIWLRRK